MNPRLSELIRKRYPVATMSPGKYAAHHGHESFFGERYYDHGDKEIEEWLNEVLRILGDPEEYALVRQEFLSEGEYAEISRHLSLVAGSLRETYPVEDLSPDEYVGRSSHIQNSLRFDSQLPHGDRTVHDWFKKVIDGMDDYDRAAKLRAEYLDEPELAEVENHIATTRSKLRERYPIGTMEPEEFVARHSHENPHIASQEQHFDNEIRDWFGRVEDLLVRLNTRESLRAEFLNQEELQAVRLEQTRVRNIVLEHFPVDTVTPEEFAARYAHTIYMLGIASLDHGDQKIADWFDELRLIMMNDRLLSELRESLLTPAELKRVKDEIREQNEPGYEL